MSPAHKKYTQRQVQYPVRVEMDIDLAGFAASALTDVIEVDVTDKPKRPDVIMQGVKTVRPAGDRITVDDGWTDGRS